MSHTERAHATLGASGAHRWMACPGSIRQSQGLVSRSSVFADEGTGAHEVAEDCLRDGIDADRLLGCGKTINGMNWEVTEEMAEAVQVFLDTVRAAMVPGDTLLVEKRFNLSRLHPGMFGTNDACVVSPSRRTLHVLDYKHGKGHAVEAQGNPQLRYYGVGALLALAEDSAFQAAGIERVVLTIVQPRAPHRDGPVRTEILDIMDLMDWTSDLVRAAKATEDVFAPLSAGGHCLFCPAAGTCPALRDKALAEAMADFSGVSVAVPKDPGVLSPAEMARMLDAADMIDQWVAAVRAHALHSAEAGLPIPGYKLVDKRATRRWAADDEAALATSLVALGASREALFKRQLVTPAQAEKLLPKSQRAEMEALVQRVSSGRNLVRDDDPRDGQEASAIADFAALA